MVEKFDDKGAKKGNFIKHIKLCKRSYTIIMKNLIFQVLGASRHKALLFITIIAMTLQTFASQMELFAIGVITQKGTDFFNLFSPGSKEVSLSEVQKLWPEIAGTSDLPITAAEATSYLAKTNSLGLIDKVMGTVNRFLPVSDNLQNLAFLLIAVALFKAITMFIQRYSMKLIAIRVSADLRQEYFEKIQSLPMSFYQEQNSGSLSSRVLGDSSLVAEALNACMANYFQTPFTVLTTLVLCFIASWQLSLLIFIGLPMIILPIVYLARGVKRISRQIQQNQEKFASVLIDFISGIQTVKVFAMEKFSLDKYAEQNNRMTELEEKSARYDLSTRPIVHTLGMFFLAVAMMYGLYGLEMSITDILVYCGLLYLFYEPVKKFAEENSRIQRGISAAERMHDIFETKATSEVAHIETQGKDLQGFNQSIVFKDVYFSYPKENQDEDFAKKWVLNGVNLEIKKGETLAIVGSTGSGKSTIVQLLPRLYDPVQGKILIDNVDILEYSPRSLREKIAFVPQKPFLFLDTIAANIAHGRPYTRKEVMLAAKRAHADEFIVKLPEGYDTVLSEAGKNLSGGQQQRLAIARALVKKAPILILDEATSSLDPVSENLIKQAVHELRGEMTQIIIAHRLSTIEDADRIIVLEHGRILSAGTREELLKSCTQFQLMWEMLQMTVRT